MRLDKFLKVSRLIKRRVIAKEQADRGYILLNSNIAKASSNVDVGDIITIVKMNKKYKIKCILFSANEEKSKTMYEEL